MRKTFHRVHHYSYRPMVITNTSSTWQVHPTFYGTATDSARNSRDRGFLLPAVGPSHRPDVLGMRKDRPCVEKSPICPVCAREGCRYHSSGKYALFYSTITLLALAAVPWLRRFPTSFSSSRHFGSSGACECLRGSVSVSSPFSRVP